MSRLLLIEVCRKPPVGHPGRDSLTHECAGSSFVRRAVVAISTGENWPLRRVRASPIKARRRNRGSPWRVSFTRPVDEALRPPLGGSMQFADGDALPLPRRCLPRSMPAALILSLPVDGHRRQQEKPHSQCASIPELANERREIRLNSSSTAMYGGIAAALEPDPSAPNGRRLQTRVPIDTLRNPILDAAGARHTI